MCILTFSAARTRRRRPRGRAVCRADVCDSRAEALEFAENLRYQVRLAAHLRNREETLGENGMLRVDWL